MNIGLFAERKRNKTLSSYIREITKKSGIYEYDICRHFNANYYLEYEKSSVHNHTDQSVGISKQDRLHVSILVGYTIIFVYCHAFVALTEINLTLYNEWICFQIPTTLSQETTCSYDRMLNVQLINVQDIRNEYSCKSHECAILILIFFCFVRT